MAEIPLISPRFYTYCLPASKLQCHLPVPVLELLMQPRLSSSSVGLRVRVGFSELCGEADYFPPKPKGGADSWVMALQGSSCSLVGGWGCSRCFPSPNPGAKRRAPEITQEPGKITPHHHTGLGARGKP